MSFYLYCSLKEKRERKMCCTALVLPLAGFFILKWHIMNKCFACFCSFRSFAISRSDILLKNVM